MFEKVQHMYCCSEFIKEYKGKKQVKGKGKEARERVRGLFIVFLCLAFMNVGIQVLLLIGS